MKLRFDGIPDQHLYTPRFSPWTGDVAFRAYDQFCDGLSITSPESRYALFALANQALSIEGEFWECGVFKGGTARMLAAMIADHGERPLRLFDTFEGSPPIDQDFDMVYPKRDNTSDEEKLLLCERAVQARLAGRDFVSFHKGLVPDTFKGLAPTAIALAHIDVDLYQGVRGCCEFIYPLMAAGGIMIFDDYGYASCPGARKAVEDFFADKPEFPIVSPSGQALVFKLPQQQTKNS